MQDKIDCLNDLFHYKADTANYLIHISNKYKYVYFETPKVACSTIKNTLQLMEIEATNFKLPENTHDKKASPLLSPLELWHPLSFHLKSHFTFGFVRNPYTRILSCYLDKIAGSTWEKNIRLPKLDMSPATILTFEEFLVQVKKFQFSDMDIHWMPQTLLLSTDKIDLDFIGKQENFNKDFAKVLAKLTSHPFDESKISSERKHSVGADKKLKKHLNNKIIALIQEIYYDDFKAYGYGFDPELA